MGQLLGPDFPTDIALAVSGGGDSMAMLYLTHNWTREFGVKLWVVTIDHGLRPESAEEAEMVAKECKMLGWPHATLRWRWDGQGNVMDAARHARLSLIDRWREGLEHVLMAHTADDVAETFLMRLKRGSGVEGLSAIEADHYVTPHLGGKPGLSKDDYLATVFPPLPTRRVAGVPAFSPGFHVIRPLLSAGREELRHYLRTFQGPWVDDPSNDNRDYDRVKMRQLLATLENEGLGVGTLAPTAHRLARAGKALQARAADVFAKIGAFDASAGQVLLNRDGFAAVEEDTQLRILAAALQRISQNPYRPRLSALEGLLDRALSGGGGTLHGCELRSEREHLRLFREFNAVKDTTVPSGQYWDDRVRFFGAEVKGLTTRALADDGWAQIPDRSDAKIPFHAARSLPAVFDKERLVACPALSFGPSVGVEIRNNTSLFPLIPPDLQF